MAGPFRKKPKSGCRKASISRREIQKVLGPTGRKRPGAPLISRAVALGAQLMLAPVILMRLATWLGIATRSRMPRVAVIMTLLAHYKPEGAAETPAEVMKRADWVPPEQAKAVTTPESVGQACALGLLGQLEIMEAPTKIGAGVHYGDNHYLLPRVRKNLGKPKNRDRLPFLHLWRTAMSKRPTATAASIYPRRRSPADAIASTANGSRKTVHGSLSDAKKELRRLIKSGDTGEHIEPDQNDGRAMDRSWIEAGAPGAKKRSVSASGALERYEELLRVHVKPVIGNRRIQQLQPQEIDNFIQIWRKRRRSPPGHNTTFTSSWAPASGTAARKACLVDQPNAAGRTNSFGQAGPD